MTAGLLAKYYEQLLKKKQLINEIYQALKDIYLPYS